MKHPNILLQMAVVISSVLLISGFVSYRAGGFDRYLSRGAAPAGDAESSPATDQELFYSSKVGKIFDPAKSQQPAPESTQPTPTILPGSKSLAPLVPLSPPSTPGTQPPSTPQPSRPTP